MKNAIQGFGTTCQNIVEVLLQSNLALRAEVDNLQTRLNNADEDRATLREEFKALREAVATQQGNQASEITQLKSQCDDLVRASADLNAELNLTKSEHSSALNDIRTKFQTTLSCIADAQRAFDQAIKALTELYKDLDASQVQASTAATATLTVVEKGKETT